MKILKSKRTISVELATEEDQQHLELEILTALQWWKATIQPARRYVWSHTVVIQKRSAAVISKR